MNREIKFRVWDGNKMLPLVGLILNPQLEIVKCLGLHTDEKAIEMQNPILLQYTGLKDKNGVEIYEGDICESYDGDIGVIQWDADTLSFIRFVNNGIDDYRNYSFKDFEVKGNIYQHPNY